MIGKLGLTTKAFSPMQLEVALVECFNLIKEILP